MIYLAIILIGFLLCAWSSEQKMKEWKKHKKACKKRGIIPDQSMWIPR